jgi:hypothetical protein
MIPRAIVCALITSVFVGAPPANRVEPGLRALLGSQFRFSPRDLDDLERGTVVTHTLGASGGGEVAAVTATWVDASASEFVAAFRDIAEFKRGEEVLQIGKFADPPALDDLAALTITDEDFDGRECHVADCPIRLPADAIRRIEREVDWRAPDANRRASDLFKQLLVADVRAYWTGSQGRFAEYNDGKKPIRPLDDFAEVLKSSPYIDALVPGLAAHLAGFPHAPVADAEEFLYWSKEKFGFTPFITVTHVTIAYAPSGAAVITTKDVYSSRYFDTSLGLTIASDATDGGRGFYLVYVNRSRANALKGRFSGLRRSIVERKAASGMAATVKTLKTRLEHRR